MCDFLKKTIAAFFIFSTLFVSFSINSAQASEISSVGYVHSAMTRLKDVTLPIFETTSTKKINSVKYLMVQIDHANEILNGFRITDYANSDELPPKALTTTSAVDKNISDLVKKMDYFELTISDVSSFNFQISASGDFIIYWGDDTYEKIKKTDTKNTTYSHTYSATGTYNIRLYGKATGYNTSTSQAAISFYDSVNKESITSISGGLGRIFSTLENGENPRFYNTFKDCIGLGGSIPGDLFSGIKGAPQSHMFHYTFSGCSGLKGSIPADLFSGISGAPAAHMYNYTFVNCSGLTGTLSPKLFGNLSGAPADYMFHGTFSYCHGLDGSIPGDLFGNIYGAPAPAMFSGTFRGCSGLSGKIPAGLFGNISGAPQRQMFYSTFQFCSNLTGDIPSKLFGAFYGAPAENMFGSTFYRCSGLTGIENGIWDLSGISSSETASDMFYRTFYGCSSITSASPSIAPNSATKLWEYFTIDERAYTFTGSPNLADYDDIPAEWK